MVYLNHDVYLVEGILNSAIYDLTNKKLFHLNNDAKNALKRAISSKDIIYNQAEENFINELLKKEILTKEFVKEHDIMDLRKESSIDFVWIEITNKCNLQCVHCYDEASNLNSQIMSYNDFCYIIDELVKNKIKKIQLIGGEPLLLGNKLINYLDYCKEKFEYIEIFTNATLMTDDLLKYFKENNIKIAVSVYSYNADEHNKVTQNENSFSLTNKAISKLREYGIKYRVRNVLMDNLIQGEKNTDLYTLSKTRDIVRMAGRANVKLLNHKLISEKLITKDTFSALELNRNFIARLVSGHNCFSRRLYFSVDLEVYPCVMERRISHGNLKNDNLKNLINPKILKFNKEFINGCKDCEFRYVCFDCRPDSLEENVAEKPWYCTYNPYTGIWLDKSAFADNILSSYKK